MLSKDDDSIKLECNSKSIVTGNNTLYSVVQQPLTNAVSLISHEIVQYQ